MTRATDIVRKMPLNNIAKMSIRPDADHMAQLIAFHDTYNVPQMYLGNQDEEFLHMTRERLALRVNMILEEVGELLTDGLGGPSPHSIDLHEGIYSGDIGQRNGEQVADALGDIVYLCYGFALECGYDLRPVLEEIHAANLTKLGEDGKPIFREDGKVLKGPSYHAPNIRAALGWEPKQ